MSTATTVGLQAFEILKECAQFVPIPLIGTAAEIAIRLLEISMEIKSNREGFIEVGTMACETMKDIVERTDRRKHPDLAISEQFKRDIEQITKDLQYIQYTVITHSNKRKSAWKRIFYHVPDAEVVTQCKNKFEETTKRFNHQSMLEVRLTTDQMNSQIERAVEKAQMAPALAVSALQAEMAHSASSSSGSYSGSYSGSGSAPQLPSYTQSYFNPQRPSICLDDLLPPLPPVTLPRPNQQYPESLHSTINSLIQGATMDQMPQQGSRVKNKTFNIKVKKGDVHLDFKKIWTIGGR